MPGMLVAANLIIDEVSLFSGHMVAEKLLM